VQPSEGSLYASPLATPWGVVCATLDGWLVSISLETGASLWKNSLGHPLFTNPLYSLGLDLVYVGSVNKTCYAVCARDGSIVWQLSTEAPIFSSPVMYGKDGVLFGCHDRNLYLVDSASGRLIWRCELDGEIFASPDFETDGGRIVATTTSGGVHLVSRNGEKLGSFQLGSHVFSSPLFLPGRILVGSRDNFLYCFKEENLSCGRDKEG
jgi:outer membrane protein assembly factor BamB